MKKTRYLIELTKGKPVCYKALIWKEITLLKTGELCILAKLVKA